MKVNSDGWAEMEHAGEDVPAAMHNAMVIHRRKQQTIPLKSWGEAVKRYDEPPSKTVCCFCAREAGSFEGMWVMIPGWHRHAFTCGHETKYECPECYKTNETFAKCSQCGCGEEWM